MIHVVPQPGQATACALFLLVITVSTTTTGKVYISPQTIAGAQTIDAERLMELVELNDKPIIIDSRIRFERKPAYIPGSISLPDTQTRCDSLAELIDEKSCPVIKTEYRATLATLGDDEFGMLPPTFENEQQAISVARRVIGSLDSVYSVDDQTLGLRCCIGISIYPDHGEREQELIINAGKAMFEARQR